MKTDNFTQKNKLHDILAKDFFEKHLYEGKKKRET
jgi:hypothetical protein